MKPKIVVIGDRKKEKTAKVIKEIQTWLDKNTEIVGIDLVNRLDLAKVKADLIMVLGGDGSIISTARRLGKNQIPVLGINLGKFGFLASYTLGELKGALESFLKKKYKPVPRMMLECRIIRRNKQIGSFWALNDVVLTRGSISRMIYIRLLINKKMVTVFGGDGLIISTAIGSTAHSLSAGGPILHPELKVIILTPICPHTLTMRPLVVPSSELITLGLATQTEEVILTVDGQVFMSLRKNDDIVVTSAHAVFHLIEPKRRTFYDTLRKKLFWGGQPHQS